MRYVSGKHLLTKYKAVVVLIELSEFHVFLALAHLVSFLQPKNLKKVAG